MTTPVTAPAAGTVVANRYRLDSPVAGDASGLLFRATDVQAQAAVLVRVLPAGADPARAARLAALAAGLAHGNAVRALDAGTDAAAGLQYVACDAGAGGTLGALLAQRGAPPLAIGTRMVHEAASALAAAHAAGIVHGDLHPGLLWLTRGDGRLRLQVLGLGLDAAGIPPARATARYAAPERLRREGEPSAAADVFSLGVIAYELLAGLPADWNTRLIAMARGQAAEVPSPRDARPELPAQVADAIVRALAADPSARWADAGALLEAIAPTGRPPASDVADQARTPAPSPAPSAAPPRPERTAPSARDRRSSVAATDLGDSLYIPPARPERPATAAAEDTVRPAPPTDAPTPPAAGPSPSASGTRAGATATSAADSVDAAPPAPEESAEPVADVSGAATPPVAAPRASADAESQTAPAAISPAEVTRSDSPPSASAPVAAATADAAAPAPRQSAPIPPSTRRRPGLERLGGAPKRGRRGMVIAAAAVGVLVLGGAVAATAMARGGDVGAEMTQRLASNALQPRTEGDGDGVTETREAAPESVAAEPSAPPVADADADEQRRREEERRREDERRAEEERRREAQRRADSLRTAQAAAPVAAPTQPVAAPLQSRPTPQVENRVAIEAPAPAAAQPAAPARPDPDRVYGPGEVDRVPQLSNRSSFAAAAAQSYPATLRGTRTWGSAVVTFVVQPDGRVDRSSITVGEVSHPAFRGAAVAAISAARFSPARVDGRPVRAQVSMPLTWQPPANDDD